MSSEERSLAELCVSDVAWRDTCFIIAHIATTKGGAGVTSGNEKEPPEHVLTAQQQEIEQFREKL